MGQAEHDRDAVARGRALTALVRPYLPVDVLVHGPADAWPLVGPALIARATGSLEAILALVPLGREADADTLLRSLYEHVTSFAWPAAEPGEERMRRWLKSDCEARMRTDDDCRKVGVKILDDDRRREFEETVAALPKGMPALLDRAQAADAHWASRITGLRDSTTPTSFRGLYAAAYRRLSAIAHPTNLGLNPVTVDLDGPHTRVQLHRPWPHRARARSKRRRCSPRHSTGSVLAYLSSYSQMVRTNRLGCLRPLIVGSRQGRSRGSRITP